MRAEISYPGDSSTTPRPSQFWFALAAILLLFGACSGGSEVAIDDSGQTEPSEAGFISGERVDGDGEEVVEEGAVVEEEVSEIPEALGNVDDPESEATTTTTEAVTPPTTQADDGSTTPIEEILDPDEYGAFPTRMTGLGVVTEPGDPLNVRTGPGSQFEIIGELDHLTTGIVSTHVTETNVETNPTEWRFIEVDGEPLGWVAGRFLQRSNGLAFCTAPEEMPIGLVGRSPVRVDIDADGIDEDVAVFNDEIANGQRLWIRSDLSSGGVVAGTIRVATEFSSYGLDVRYVTNSDALNFNSQFMVETGQRPAASQWTIFALDGCDISVTTLDGRPFTYIDRENRQWGCIYGGGENRFVTYEDDGGTRTSKEYELNGTEWTFEAQMLADANAGADSLPAGFTSCLDE